MGSFPTSGYAWMATTGAIVCFALVYSSFIVRNFSIRSARHPVRRLGRSISAMSRAGRGSRVRRFESIARGVVSDVEDALQPPLCHRHARSFLPILSDVRRRGQLLLQQQTNAHRVASPDRERDLTNLVMRLFTLEAQLKALPKPSVTIEEVLSGKFE
ncbi:MAG: hypothetical protein RLZZ488_250 [Pseudomonadota bacterium]